MKSIRRKLSLLIVSCSLVAIIFIILFVNITINNEFNKYVEDIQNKRYERIVDYFKEIYKKEGKWNKDSGRELEHESYMGNYCLTLLDKDKNQVWGMEHNNLKFNSMPVQNSGVYNTKTFPIYFKDEIVGYVEIGQYSSVLLTEDDMNFKSSINKSIIVSGVFALIIIILVSIYVSMKFSKPIKEMANMSVKLSKGKFSLESRNKSDIKELENLRNSMNILAKKLETQDKIRRRLVADISHEIRTPLNILQNNLEAMIDGIFPVTTEKLNYLNNEVVRFGKLLNNLDTLKEFEDEGIRLNLERLNLNEVIVSVTKDFEALANKKGIKLSFDTLNEDIRLQGDRDKLKQVFINLVSNALKFTKEGGTVNIRAYTKGECAVVEVEDNGIGIKSEDLPFIFERLYRGDKGRLESEGTGIGLTVVKSVLQMHSATIKVHSEEGMGSKFIIFFNRFI